MNTVKRVAVIGASGFIGTAVVQALESQGYATVKIRAPRLHSAGTEGHSSADEAIEYLIENMRDVSVVINAAGDPDASSLDSAALLATNGLLPGLIARAANAANVERFIHISSAVVQGRLPELDSSLRYDAISPYASSKMHGERQVMVYMPEGRRVIFRPPSVHAPSRRISRMISKIASSPLSSVANASAPTPQAHVTNVANAIAFLAVTEQLPPSVVHYPWEGLTTQSLLELLGARAPISLPDSLAKLIVSLGFRLSQRAPALLANVRRVEMLWFGQRQAVSWLTQAGWQPVLGEAAWCDLGLALREGRRRRASGAPDTQRPRILLTVTIDQSLQFIRDLASALAAEGWDVHVATSPGPNLRHLGSVKNITAHEVPMERDPSIIRDIVAAIRWVKLLRHVRPEILLAGTPKASLLSLTAARLVRVPVRIYHVLGLRLETVTGGARPVLWSMERVAASSSTRLLSVSSSLSRSLSRLRIARQSRIDIVGNGSSHGVNIKRFMPDDSHAHDVAEAKLRLGLTGTAVTIGYVGRIHPDKGLDTLVDAMNTLVDAGHEVDLLAIGDRDREGYSPFTPARFSVAHVDRTDDVRSYYALMDIFCLPTLREGMPNVVLEAASMRLPVVTTTATGAIDSVDPGRTGILVDTGNARQLRSALESLIINEERRTEMGRAGRDWVSANFASTDVIGGTVAYVSRHLKGAQRDRR